MHVTILGPNLPSHLSDKGELHVHAAGCGDIARRYPRRFDTDPHTWSFDADTVDDVVEEIYPPDNFNYDPNDPADRAQYDSDVWFAPCCHSLKARTVNA